MGGKVVLSFILSHLGLGFLTVPPPSLLPSVESVRNKPVEQAPSLLALRLLGHRLEHGLLSPSTAVLPL